MSAVVPLQHVWALSADVAAPRPRAWPSLWPVAIRGGQDLHGAGQPAERLSDAARPGWGPGCWRGVHSARFTSPGGVFGWLDYHM